MTASSSERTILAPLSAQVRHLVRIAGAIAGSDEATVRAVMIEAVNGGPKRAETPAGSGSPRVDPAAVEEIILQSYLFAGFPRALNAARTWRSVSGTAAPKNDTESDAADLDVWRERGLATCEIVYGESYERLRRNIRALHPALDDWMIVDGYGKVLSRPGVDLRTRELCVVAACAVAGQQRQLHSHLGGALNAGASFEEVAAVLEVIKDLITDEELSKYHQLLRKVATQ
jgi:4-carboxymuconolactone decarboxylase